jgi:hypothetical protein
MESNARLSVATTILAVACAFLTASMGLYVLGLGDWMFTAVLAWPGAFLVQSFSVFSLYVPALLGTLAWLTTRPVSPPLLTGLGFSLLPFLTLSALAHVLDPTSTVSAAVWLREAMGAPAPVFLGLVTVLELLVGAAATLAVRNATAPTEPAATSVPESDFEIPTLHGDPAPAYETLKAAFVSEAEYPQPAAPEASAPSEPDAPETPATDVLQVPHIKEWNTARALRDDPFFVTADSREYSSPALEALNKTLAGMPLEDDADVFDEDPDWLTATELPDERAALAEIFGPEGDHVIEDDLETATVPVVDWDHLVPGPAPVSDSLDDADFDDEDDADPAVEEAIHVLDQPSALIRPLEGGNFPVRTVHVRPEREPAETEAAAETVWAQRPKFKGWHVPVDGLLTAYKEATFGEVDEATRRAGHTLKMTLKEFNIEADVTGIRKGPVVTMFEILPAAGVKLSKIVALADNIALGLAATSIRIVAPIPGKHAVGIEVPNRERTIVGFAEMVGSKEFQESRAEIPMVLGRDIGGETQIIDLTRTPHLLIAGATGAGKSVCVNTLVCSILYRRSPDEVKLLMVDPKIVELKFFNDIPHLLAPVITDPKKALQAVQWCLYEMERRYALLDAIGAKDIRSYNAKVEKRHIATTKLPYIVLVIDEFADLMATSGKDLEGTIARLAAMSRAVGIHLVLATQRPSVDVITGLIKANFPSRIAFMVASKTDSRIIIDQMGAEKLLGRGDMLFTSSWNPFPSRIQGAFLSEDDVERVVTHVKTLGEPEYISDEIFFDEEEEDALDAGMSADEMDPLFEKGVEIVRTFKKASASFLQRRLGVGYNRAARMIELMEEMGIVGPQNGSKPREIVHG